MWNPLNLLPNRQIDEFARTLAREFAERFPAEIQPKRADDRAEKSGAPHDAVVKELYGKARKVRKGQLERVLDGLYAKAREYRDAHSLGVYGKARLGNTFKWELREMGYEPEFVEEAARGLIHGLSRG